VSLADIDLGVQALAEQIEHVGSRAVAIITDVGEDHQARAFIEQIRDRHSRVDALVNNADVMRPGPVDGAATDQWREMIHTNVMGVLYCTRAALPAMRAQGSGPIVNVSSMSGRRPRAGTGVYSLTKFEVNGFPIRFATKPPSTVSRPLSSNQGSSPPPATTQGALGAQF
jgi:clavulanate-9-aldehyde reducatase